MAASTAAAAGRSRRVSRSTRKSSSSIPTRKGSPVPKASSTGALHPEGGPCGDAVDHQAAQRAGDSGHGLDDRRTVTLRDRRAGLARGGHHLPHRLVADALPQTLVGNGEPGASLWLTGSPLEDVDLRPAAGRRTAV